MPHIHTQHGQHDLTASAYIVRTDMDEPRLLLHKHKKLEVFLQVGGHTELDETPWRAVVHEILEESGYAKRQLSVLQPPIRILHLSDVDLHPYPLVLLTHEFSDGHFHSDIGWAFVTDQPPQHPVSDGESSDIRFFARQELHELPADEIPEDVREIGLFVLDTCLASWDRVRIAD